MKSKAEIIDALKRCRMKEWTCDQCKYYPLGDHCWDALHSDILEYLNKSDFEVVKEVLDKSLILDWEYYSEDDDYYGTKRLSAKDDRGVVYKIAFDMEGNIL